MKKNKKKQVLELNYWNSASVIKTMVSNLIQVLKNEITLLGTEKQALLLPLNRLIRCSLQDHLLHVDDFPTISRHSFRHILKHRECAWTARL